jgi:hypothetical protein
VRRRGEKEEDRPRGLGATAVVEATESSMTDVVVEGSTERSTRALTKVAVACTEFRFVVCRLKGTAVRADYSERVSAWS